VLFGDIDSFEHSLVVLEQLRWHLNTVHLNNLAANLRLIHTDRYILSPLFARCIVEVEQHL